RREVAVMTRGADAAHPLLQARSHDFPECWPECSLETLADGGEVPRARHVCLGRNGGHADFSTWPACSFRPSRFDDLKPPKHLGVKLAWLRGQRALHWREYQRLPP